MKNCFLVDDLKLFNSMGNLTFDGYITDQITLRNHSRWMSMEENLKQAAEFMAADRERGVLLLEGGGDISPALYGQQEEHCGYISPERDTWELSLIGIAEELNIPILGICRGHQLYAAYRGGSLHQDISACLRVYGHRGGELDLSGMFAEWYPEGYVANSAHHQCVDRVPEGAEVIARDRRNPEIIEAIVYPRTESFVPTFTVQFHPEFLRDAELLTKIRDYLLAN